MDKYVYNKFMYNMIGGTINKNIIYLPDRFDCLESNDCYEYDVKDGKEEYKLLLIVQIRVKKNMQRRGYGLRIISDLFKIYKYVAIYGSVSGFWKSNVFNHVDSGSMGRIIRQLKQNINDIHTNNINYILVGPIKNFNRIYFINSSLGMYYFTWVINDREIQICLIDMSTTSNNNITSNDIIQLCTDYPLIIITDIKEGNTFDWTIFKKISEENEESMHKLLNNVHGIDMHLFRIDHIFGNI